MRDQELGYISALIRVGQIGAARREICAFLDDGVRRDERVAVAQIMRRLGFLHRAVSLLYPLVYADGQRSLVCSDEEKIEYATCISRLGGGREAQRLLGTVNVSDHPEALFSHAAALISDWQQENAVPLLESYIRAAKIPDYSRLVGLVNLSACLVFLERYDAAEKRLRECRSLIPKLGARLLLANTLEMEAQIAFERLELGNCVRLLFDVRKVLSDTNLSDSFNVARLECAVIAKLHGPTESLSLMVRSLKQRAKRHKHYETMRQLDFQLGLVLRNAAMLTRVYVGSNYTALRAKIRRRSIAENIELGDELWLNDAKRGSGQNYFDVFEGNCGKAGIKRGSILYALLSALASDLYRPRPLLALSETLFSGRIISPASAYTALHSNISRLRRVLLAGGTASKVVVEDGCCSIDFGNRLPVRLTAHQRKAEEAYFDKLKAVCKQRVFCASDAAAIWKLPKRTANRIIETLVETGLVFRLGKGKSTYYRFSET